MERNSSELDKEIALIKQHLVHHDARIGDTKTFLNIFATVFGVVLGSFAVAIALVGYFQFNREIDRLGRFEEEIQQQLGLLQDKSEIQIASISGDSLESSTLPAVIRYFPNRHRISLGFRMKNIGSTYADVRQIKIYTDDPLPIQFPAGSDRSEFKYEVIETIDDDEYGTIIPPNSSIRIFYTYDLKTEIHGTIDPAEAYCIEGEHDAQIVISYGQDKETSKEVTFLVENERIENCRKQD